MKAHKDGISIIAAIAVVLLTSQLAQAISLPATLKQKPNVNDQCTVREPQQNGRPPSSDGMSASELIALTQINKNDADWVKWYVGGQKYFDQLLKNNTTGASPTASAGARIPYNAAKQNDLTGQVVSWGKCADVGNFLQIANRDLFMTPKMVCSSGSVGFSFSLSNNMMVMELDQITASTPTIIPPASIPGQQVVGAGNGMLPGLMVASQGQMQVIQGVPTRRVLAREPVLFELSKSSDCPMKVSEISGSGLNIKICLPTTPENKDGEGRVAMTLYGSDQTGDLACDADRGFLDLVQTYKGTGLVKNMQLLPPNPGGPTTPPQISISK